MGSTSRYGRATINPNDPNALGICDRCGFLFNLRTLRWQMEWCGTTMQNLHLRVCPQCWDVPQEQLRTIILPADPPSVRDPRTEPFFIDQVNELTLSKIIGKPYMLLAESTMVCEIDSGLGIVAAFGDISNVSAGLSLGILLGASFSDASNVVATLMRGVGLNAAIDGVSNMVADVDVVTPAGAPSIIWTDDFIDSSGSTSPITATAMDIGTADAGRIVVAIIQITDTSGDRSVAITGVTIGGVTAKRVSLIGSGTIVPVLTEMWWANVPTGTTANVVVTFTGAAGGVFSNFDVYAAYDVETSFPFYDTNEAWAASATVSASISIPADSASVGGSYDGFNSVGTSVTWTNLTEDNDNSFDIGGLFVTFGAASRDDASSAGSVSVQAQAASADTVAASNIVAGVLTANPGEKWIVVTATDTAFPVPSDWNDADNSVYAIGSSADATDPGAVGGGGTGGGAWARTDNLNLTGGGTCRIVIGSNGSDTYLSNTGGAPTSTSEGVLAKGGTTNSGITAGTGGASGSCIGTAANSGGNGGAGQNADNGAGGGGGGAGGPNGAGANGAAGAAGTGGGAGAANGGSAAPGGQGGGASRTGFAGGTTNGALAYRGAGAAGKSTAGAAAGTADMEPIYIDSSSGALAGPGGGGGGGRGGGATNATATGGQGGLYGGGAGGSGENALSHASGRNGVVVIRYRP